METTTSNVETDVMDEPEIPEEEEALIEVAMQIILHAGDARNFAKDALKAAKISDFAQADDLMKQADVQILEAHHAQTDIIQRAMGGESYPYSILFSHAQDTLMTIKTELNLSRELIDVLHIVYANKEA